MTDKLEKYSALYALTYKRRGIPMRLIIPFMKKWQKEANRLLEDKKEFYSTTRLRHAEKINDLIVSLTSFPARIDHVWKTIVSLKNQTVLPEKIILWLSKEEFGNKRLPDVLEGMQDDLFEIRWIEENLRSHNKYYYAFQEFPEKTIITVDDDQYYQKDTLKSLIENSLKYPGDIISNRVRKIGIKDGELLPYNKWKWQGNKKDDSNLFQMGVDGALYPPQSLAREVFEKETLLLLTPFADDIWLNAMTRLKGTKVRYTGRRYRNIPVALETPSLETKNCCEGLNDTQIATLRKYFKQSKGIDLYEK